MKRRVPDPDPPDPGFNCWSRLPHRISCVWSRDIPSPEVNCKKVHESDPNATKRCFIDPSLATEEKIGCTTDSLADFYSQYEIELSSSGVELARMDDFDIGKYCKLSWTLLLPVSALISDRQKGLPAEKQD